MTTAESQTCRSIMTADPVVIRRTDTVGKALQILLEKRLLALPMVDESGRYLGMFLRSRLVSLLLPKIVQLEERLPEIGRLVELGFLTNTLDDLRERFSAVADHPVEAFAEDKTPVLRPDTPVMTAVLYLYRTRTLLPVVDEASGRLVGVVSTWDILGRIAGRPG